jgi:hypothetical protein
LTVPLTHACTVSVTSKTMSDELAEIAPKVKLSFWGDASSPSAVTPATRLFQVAVGFHGTSMRWRCTGVPGSKALTTRRAL